MSACHMSFHQLACQPIIAVHRQLCPPVIFQFNAFIYICVLVCVLKYLCACGGGGGGGGGVCVCVCVCV